MEKSSFIFNYHNCIASHLNNVWEPLLSISNGNVWISNIDRVIQTDCGLELGQNCVLELFDIDAVNKIILCGGSVLKTGPCDSTGGKNEWCILTIVVPCSINLA